MVATAAVPTSRTSALRPVPAPRAGRRRVLVVDDEQEIVDVLSKVLGEQANYEVRTAINGFQAGMEAERFKPHVMLLDVHLGEGDIKQISSFVRSDDDLQMCKIIAMSGKLTDGQLAGMKGQGFDGFLKKPFAVRQVVEAIEHATSLVN